MTIKRMISLIVFVFVIFSICTTTITTSANDVQVNQEQVQAIPFGEEVLFEDFENSVSPLFTPDSRLTVVDDSGNKVLRINGISAYPSTKTISGNLEDFMVEVDFKQVNATAFTTGGSSIALRAVNFGTSSYRFAYTDSIRYNAITHRADGADRFRDRMALGRSDDFHDMGRFYYAKISDNSTDLLNLTDRSTPWIKAKAVIYHGMMYYTYYDMNGNVLSSLSASIKDADWGAILSNGINSIPNGGVILAAHSSDVYFDNLRITRLLDLKDFKMKIALNRADTIQPVRFNVQFIDGNDNEIEVENSNYEIIGDPSILVDREHRLLRFTQSGTYDVTLRYTDPVFNQILEQTQQVVVIDKFNYEQLGISLENQHAFKGASVGYSVYGITNNMDKLEIAEGYQITGDSIVVDQNTLKGMEEGVLEINAAYDGLSTTTNLNVSKFEEMSFSLSNTQPKVGEEASFVLSGLVNGEERIINSGEYSVIYDSKDFSIENNIIKFLRYGAHKIAFVVEGVEVDYMIDVQEKDHGELLFETFEDNEPVSEYLQYDKNDVVAYGDGKALKLLNKSTPLFGLKTWKDYTIEAKIKITKPVIESSQYLSSFEVLMRRGEKLIDGTDGSLGIPFVYRTSYNKGGYARIGTLKGKDINIDDGEWHNISVSSFGNQMIFKIDDTIQYHQGNFNPTGYFQLRANNSEVLIDHIKVIKSSFESIGNVLTDVVAEENEVLVNPYNVYDLANLNAVKAIYEDGSQKYITRDVSWELVSGSEYAEFYNGSTIRFKPDIKTGDSLVLKGTYGGKSFTFHVIVQSPDISLLEYTKLTIEQRRESYAYLLANKLGGRAVINQGTLGAMAEIFGQMVLYPRLYDYTPFVMWHVIQSEYEEKVKTRALGGGDFVMLQMLTLYKELYGKINVSQEAWDKLKKYLIETEYPDEEEWMSENHRVVYFAMALLAAETWPDQTMMKGRSAAEMTEIYTGYLAQWIDTRLRTGMGEYDSGYYSVDLFALEILYTYIQDPHIKSMTGDMITYLYADLLNDAIDSSIGGANLRMYVLQRNNTRKLQNFDILFNNGTEVMDETYPSSLQTANNLLSTYQPPEVLYKLALDRDKSYVNKERKGVYRIPDDPLVVESLSKYTYVTSEYALGAQIHSDNTDQYVNNIALTGTWPAGTTILTGHQETPWTLTLGKSNSAMILDSHPGPGGPADTNGVHGYFTGDYKCICYQYHQQRNVSIGMHKITQANEAKFTHFWFPRTSFERVDEESGWIFAKYLNTYIALRPLKNGQTTTEKQYEWGDKNTTYAGIPLSDIEVKINSAHTAFVVEVYNTKEFEGSYEDFKQTIKQNEANHPIKYSVADDYYIEYTALSGETLKIDYDNNKRYTDGVEIDFDNYKLHDSPFMKADWNGGRIELAYKGEFYNITSPLEPVMSAPTATVAYSVTSATHREVVATITPSEPVTITNNGGSDSYTFYWNGSFTFEFVNAAGIHGTVTATVNNIASPSTAKPGTPILSHDNGWGTGLQDGSYNIMMNMWSGDNGKIYKLFENDVLIETKILTDHSPIAQSILTSVTSKPNGIYRYYAELTNEFGTTRSNELTVNVTHAAPAKPDLANDNWDGDGNYTVTMNMWWGTNGGTYRLYENDMLIDTQVLNMNSPSAQSAVSVITNRAKGTYHYRGELVNDAGATSSDTITVQVTQ